jgi:hypothetical protein
MSGEAGATLEGEVGYMKKKSRRSQLDRLIAECDLLRERVKDLRLALSDQAWLDFAKPSAKTEAARRKLAQKELDLDAAKEKVKSDD